MSTNIGYNKISSIFCMFGGINNCQSSQKIVGLTIGDNFRDITHSVMRELDLSHFLFKSELPNSSYIDIYLSSDDLNYNDNKKKEFLLDIGYIKDELNPWRKAKIRVGSEKISMEYKFHGTSVSTLDRYDLISFKIKHNKQAPYLDEIRRFNLIPIQDDIDNSTIALNKIANEFGLMAPHGRMVVLRINGVDSGLYMLVEDHKKEWFEREHKLTNYLVIKSNDDWDRKNISHQSDFDLFIENKEISGTSLYPDIVLGRFNELLKAIINKDIQRVKLFVDLDYVSKYIALQTLYNNSHPIYGDNLRYIYDMTSGRFKFLFRLEDTLLPIANDTALFNQSWLNVHPEYAGAYTFKLFELLIQDEEVRKMRDLYLIEILSKKEEFIGIADDVFEENNKILDHYLSDSILNYNKLQFDTKLNNNFNQIERYIDYNKIYTSINQDSQTISIINDSFGEILFESLEILSNENDDKQLQIKTINMSIPSPSLDSSLLMMPSTFDIDLTSYVQDTNKITRLFFKNSLTGKYVDQSDIYINRTKKSTEMTLSDVTNILDSNKIKYFIDGNKILIKKGEYSIGSNILFPRGYSLVIEAGTKILLSENISIVIRGDFTAVGTKKNPIVVMSQNENKAFGVIGVEGSDNANIDINYLLLSGGSEAIHNGVHFTGQLSIYNTKFTSIKNSTIQNSISDDGINIKNSEVLIMNSKFINNSFDQIDLDYSFGKVYKNLFFIDPNLVREEGGDGLDLSGSNVFIQLNKFQNFTDKAISNGENSKAYIIANEIIGNKIGVAIKDGSEAYTSSNVYKNNNLDYNLFIKKPFYKSPLLYSSEEILDQKIIIDQGNFIKLSEEDILNEYNIISE